MGKHISTSGTLENDTGYKAEEDETEEDEGYDGIWTDEDEE